MVGIKEEHALINCPHCGKPIRVRARTLADKTVQQAILESKKDESLFGKIFGENFLKDFFK